MSQRASPQPLIFFLTFRKGDQGGRRLLVCNGAGFTFPLIARKVAFGHADSFRVVIQFGLWDGARWLGTHVCNLIVSGFHRNPNPALKLVLRGFNGKAAPKAFLNATNVKWFTLFR